MNCLVTALILLTAAGAASADQWNYSRIEDPMTSEVTATFSFLGSPGSHYGIFVVENRKGREIEASVSYGDIPVDCPKTCRILVRADDTVPRAFDVSRGWDRMFFRDSMDVIAYIRSAKRVRVQFRLKDTLDDRNGKSVSTFYADTPLVIYPLRGGVGQ